jgi:PAS domain S-box-containing protein
LPFLDKVNILLVDDQPAKLLSYETILDSLKENLLKATSGQEALDFLLRNEVAVILVDVCMPDIDGFELAATIRQHPRFQKTAIILVSAVHMTDLDRLKGYDCGAVDYVSVPVIPEILRAKVAVFADLYRKTQELQRMNQELESRVRERTAELEESSRRLQENEERIKLAVEGAGMATWDEDLRGGQAFWSETHFTMLGYEPIPSGKASRDMMLSCIHTEDWSRVLQALEESKLKGPYHQEYRIVRADDKRVVWVSAFGRYLFDDSGQPSRFLGVLFDITDRKQIELMRIELLGREQAARKQAEEANLAKDEFLATLSHELRTPLNAIYGWTRLLRSGKLDEIASAQALEVIERNVGAQKQLIADLLDVSGIVSGKLHLDMQPVDLLQIVQDAVKAITPAAATKKIALDLSSKGSAGLIWGDAGRLQQVVWNLLSNAVKFTPEEGTVEVHLESVDASVRIVFKDSGQGIRAEFLPFIFDRFRQADSSRTRKHGGLGLGLAIVRHLVELHGGSIKAQSDGEGLGSSFTVELPLKAFQEPSQLNSTLPVITSLATSKALKGIRLLVLDDEPTSCDLLARALHHSGAEVKTAFSVRQALEILEQWRADVLISDICMPEEDGYDFIQKVRALSPEEGRDIPAVAVTAHAANEDRARSLSEGFQIHLTKPFEIDELVTAVYSLAHTSSLKAYRAGLDI